MPKAQGKSKRNRDARQAALSEKLTGRVFERELARLHAELVKLQFWVVNKGVKVLRPVRGPRRRGQGRGDQGNRRTRQPARVSRRRAARGD
jgi:polyphosphate kinase